LSSAHRLAEIYVNWPSNCFFHPITPDKKEPLHRQRLMEGNIQKTDH
jgi:hypothetical protein